MCHCLCLNLFKFVALFFLLHHSLIDVPCSVFKSKGIRGYFLYFIIRYSMFHIRYSNLKEFVALIFTFSLVMIKKIMYPAKKNSITGLTNNST